MAQKVVRLPRGEVAPQARSPNASSGCGLLARAVESDQLAYALDAIGGAHVEEDPARALQAAAHTTSLATALERRAAVQVVHLRDTHGLSWRQIAAGLHGDLERQSTVRRQYDSGRRHIGLHAPTRQN